MYRSIEKKKKIEKENFLEHQTLHGQIDSIDKNQSMLNELVGWLVLTRKDQLSLCSFKIYD